jgi:hypothetical protein
VTEYAAIIGVFAGLGAGIVLGFLWGLLWPSLRGQTVPRRGPPRPAPICKPRPGSASYPPSDIA